MRGSLNHKRGGKSVSKGDTSTSEDDIRGAREVNIRGARQVNM